MLLALEGLHPPSDGARDFVRRRPAEGHRRSVRRSEGSASAGYWMIQVKSKQEAIEWAKRCPGSENEIIEIRQVRRCPTSLRKYRKPPRGSPSCKRKW